MKDILENAFISEGFTLTAQQTEQFVTYYELLMEWNQKMNLTAIEDPVEVSYKRFVDSVCLLRVASDI